MNGRHAEYAGKYMEVLFSLKQGGSFLYTPDLPFIEQFLPRDAYVVSRWPVLGRDLYSATEDAKPVPAEMQAVRIEKLK